MLGTEQEAAITLSYERHEDEPLADVTGVVRRIRTMSCRYAPAPRPHDPRERRPVPGTVLIEDAAGIQRWFDTGVPGMTFRGWPVDLEVAG